MIRITFVVVLSLMTYFVGWNDGFDIGEISADAVCTIKMNGWTLIHR